MKIDLYRDWVTHLENELTAFGYDTTQMQSPEEVVHTFLNLTKRLVRPIPRTVLKAESFSCPTEHTAGLAEVETKIAVGEDLSPHLSSKIRCPSYNDGLLNHWGIHHLHLGTDVDSKGFVSRTGPILLARFDNSNAYLIDVLLHGSWCLQRLVKELHDNWPTSIQNFRISSVHSNASAISDKDIATLRKKNGNTVVDLGKGIVYAPIGGGCSVSGLSFEVLTKSNCYAMRLNQMQQDVIEKIGIIEKEAKSKGISFPNVPRFKLQIVNDSLFAVETNCLIKIPLGVLSLH